MRKLNLNKQLLIRLLKLNAEIEEAKSAIYFSKPAGPKTVERQNHMLKKKVA